MLDSLTTWHWLILAVVLLIFEALGTSGFLIGIAAAAFLMAGVVAMDIVQAWQYQLLWFSLMALVLTLLYWKVFKGFNNRSAEPLLNDRAAQLIGRRVVLEESLIAGQGRIKVGDTLWKASADTQLNAGTTVEIYASEGMMLKIKSVD